MADALFTWLDALWTKTRPEGKFPVYVAHRFLATDRDFAPFARVLYRDMKDPDLVFATWQGLLPEGIAAPRMSYGAPKKSAEAEELTQRMMSVLRESRETVEASQELVALAGLPLALYREFGVSPPEHLLDALADGGPSVQKKRKTKKEESAPGGLLGIAKGDS